MTPTSGPTAGNQRADSVWGRRVLALLAGAVCHGTFLVAVACMFLGLHDGLRGGHVHLPTHARLGWDLFLAVQFPLIHSALLTERGRRRLARALGSRHGWTLAPTTYAWTAAVQLLVTFLLWAPTGTVWWQPVSETARLVSNGLYAGAWLFLGKALLDGGLGLQTGWIGWTALWRGRRVSFPPLPKTGLFALCRQPIYLGFALTLWTGPVWTPDRLLLALVWTTYCLVGPRHKERRYRARHGEAFAEYQRRVPYMLPVPARRRVA